MGCFPLVVIAGAALYTANLSLFHFWAAGGPPTPDPAYHLHRGYCFCATSVMLTVCGLLTVVALRRRAVPDAD